MPQTDSSIDLWPKSIQGTPIPKTIETLFQAADDPTGARTFSQCFTLTGELTARGHVCKGPDEIIDFRKNVWGAINKRKQVVRKVWVSDEDRRDIVVLGDVTFGHESGQTITEQFVGNFLFGSGEDEGLIQRYQAWLDLKGLSDLIANAPSA